MTPAPATAASSEGKERRRLHHHLDVAIPDDVHAVEHADSLDRGVEAALGHQPDPVSSPTIDTSRASCPRLSPHPGQ